MTLYRKKYRIESTRLRNWDYSQNGYYFVTLCAKNRSELFGFVAKGQMTLNKYGQIVELCWLDLPNHYHNIILDEFVVMPNHFHGIIIIDNNNVETGLKPVSIIKNTKNHGLFEFVRAFKTFSARRINKLRTIETGLKPFSTAVWQSRFYDHVIRNDQSLERIRNYIINNPTNLRDDIL